MKLFSKSVDNKWRMALVGALLILTESHVSKQVFSFVIKWASRNAQPHGLYSGFIYKGFPKFFSAATRC